MFELCRMDFCINSCNQVYRIEETNNYKESKYLAMMRELKIKQ